MLGNAPRRASELAAVDATPSSEVVFAMIGEVMILGAPWPTGAAVAGVAVVFAGLGFFIHFQERGARISRAPFGPAFRGGVLLPWILKR